MHLQSHHQQSQMCLSLLHPSETKQSHWSHCPGEGVKSRGLNLGPHLLISFTLEKEAGEGSVCVPPKWGISDVLAFEHRRHFVSRLFKTGCFIRPYYLLAAVWQAKWSQGSGKPQCHLLARATLCGLCTIGMPTREIGGVSLPQSSSLQHTREPWKQFRHSSSSISPKEVVVEDFKQPQKALLYPLLCFHECVISRITRTPCDHIVASF